MGFYEKIGTIFALLLRYRFFGIVYMRGENMFTNKTKLILSTLMGGLLFMATNAMAMTTTVWNLTSSGGGVSNGNFFGNEITITEDPLMLSITSYGDTVNAAPEELLVTVC